MVKAKTEKQKRWEQKNAKLMRFFESERAGDEDKKKEKMLPPYAYTPLCPDPAYRTAYKKKEKTPDGQ